jgi:phage/plasmid-like protein (TIGR03299 family)
MTQAPWHGIGIDVRHTDNILKTADIDWRIEKRALMIHGLDQQLDTHYALVRDTDDSILGICGENYIPLQNSKAFEFFEKFVKAGSMEMEVAGSLRGGRYVFALVKINESFILPGNDKVDGYLLISSPHVWGKAMNIRFTSVRNICSNTILSTLSTKYEKFRFPHIKDFDSVAMKTAEETLNLSKLCFNRFKKQATFLSQRTFTPAQIIEFAAEMFQGDTTVRNLRKNSVDFLEVLNDSPGCEMDSARGTWWGALNAVTYLCDHKIGYSADTRLFQAWYGEKEVMKRRALDLALKYAKEG